MFSLGEIDIGSGQLGTAARGPIFFDVWIG